jgi:hypothetical protein
MRMHRRLVLASVTAALAAATLAATPASADAQRVVVRRGQPPRQPARTVVVRRDQDRWSRSGPSRALTLSVGALRYRDAADDNHPMAALRAEWRLRHWLRSELGMSYALANLEVAPEGAETAEEIDASLLTATVGLNAELPIPVVRPYVGAAVGLGARFDGDGETYDGDSFVRPLVAFPVGVRLAVSPRLGLRAEARFRFDEQQDGRSMTNVEQTIGVSFGF